KNIFISKVPDGWVTPVFTALPAQQPGTANVTLTWMGPVKGNYIITFLNAGQRIQLPARGSDPFRSSGVYPDPNKGDPELTIEETTVFTLEISVNVEGYQQPLVIEKQQTVTIGKVPNITCFKGNLQGTTGKKVLNLTWKTTESDSVQGSWTNNGIPLNPIKDYPVYPPFDPAYYLVAEAEGVTNIDTKYLYLDLVPSNTFKCGSLPWSIGITPDSGLLVVANTEVYTVSIIDTLSWSILATIPNLLLNFGRLIVLSNARALLSGVTGEVPDQYGFFLIDLENNTATQVISGIAVNGMSSQLMFDIIQNTNQILCAVNTIIARYELQNYSEVAQAVISLSPLDIAVVPNGLTAILVGIDDNIQINIAIIDIESLQVIKQRPAGFSADQVSITPDGTYALISSYQATTVQILNTADLSVVGTLDTGGSYVNAQRIDGAGKRALLCTNANTVLVLDFASFTFTKSIPVGQQPQCLAFSSDSCSAFVGNMNDGTVTAIEVNVMA
ncbi:MAG TPA: hypothetical protein VGQ53_20985, partial [Chitinophagaceae bacterium]|nr:hypothetical protein [Chitinophagaceae bacterium]